MESINKTDEVSTASKLAQYIIQNPGDFTPVYFYGNNAHVVGKAIKMCLEEKGFEVNCVSAEDFCNKYIDFLKNQRTNVRHFDERYLRSDVFIIYDIEKILNSQMKQNNIAWRIFEIIFNLLEQKKQVVITGKVPPYGYKRDCNERYTCCILSGVTCEV